MRIQITEGVLALEEKTLHILVVDDEEASRTVIAAILQRIEYAVSTACDGLEAKDLILGACREGKPFDLIITDILMPGLKGNELLAQLLERNVDIPAVAITAYGDKELVVDLLDQGFIGYLDKPFSVERIQGYLRRVFRRIERARLHAIETAAAPAPPSSLRDMEELVAEVRDLLKQHDSRVEAEFGLDFARVLRDLRESRRLTLLGLSKGAGLQAVRLNSFETNPAILPSWADLKRLADFYGLPISRLVYLAENPSAPVNGEAVAEGLGNLAGSLQ